MPVLVTVTLNADELPTATLVKVTDGGDSDSVGVMPLPVSGTVAATGVPRLSAAVFAPVDVGLNATVTVQLAPTTNPVALHVVAVMMNCEASTPVTVPPPGMSTTPVFISVKTLLAIPPGATLPKFSDVLLSDSIGETPVPVRGTSNTTGLPRFSVADFAPAVAGRKTMSSVQVAPTARLAPAAGQVLFDDLIVNCEASVPVTIAANGEGLVPGFETVTVAVTPVAPPASALPKATGAGEAASWNDSWKSFVMTTFGARLRTIVIDRK